MNSSAVVPAPGASSDPIADIEIVRRRLAKFDPPEWGGPDTSDADAALDRLEAFLRALAPGAPTSA